MLHERVGGFAPLLRIKSTEIITIVNKGMMEGTDKSANQIGNDCTKQIQFYPSPIILGCVWSKY